MGTSGATAIITLWFTRNKTNAEAERIMGEAYGGLVGDLRKEIDRLLSRVDNLEKRELKYLELIAQKDNTELALRVRIKELEAEIENLKHPNNITNETVT